MFTEELWRNISKSNGLYQISNCGRVKSFCNGKEKILSSTVNSAGYLHLTLCVNGNRRYCNVHVLVAEAFVPNPDNLPEVNHKDGNKLNNHSWNLEWTTRQKNLKHASQKGLLHIKKGENNPCAKLTMEDVRYIRQVYITHNRKFGGRALAKKFGVVPQTIYDIIRGKTYKENF